MVNFRLFFPTIFFNFPCKSTVLSNVSASFSRVRYWISIDWLLARPASDNKSVLSESESVQTEWRGSPDLHCWHHDTWQCWDQWRRQIVTMWLRLEAGSRGHRTGHPGAGAWNQTPTPAECHYPDTRSPDQMKQWEENEVIRFVPWS